MSHLSACAEGHCLRRWKKAGGSPSEASCGGKVCFDRYHQRTRQYNAPACSNTCLLRLGRTGYVLVNRMVKVDENVCTGCAMCVPVCPEGAISCMGSAHIDDLCTGCLICVDFCPLGALRRDEAVRHD